MATGIVKKMVNDHGYGFITAEHGRDCFFHRTPLAPSLDFDPLDTDEKVAFETEPSPRCPGATNVRAA